MRLARRNKFGAIRVQADGITFDSKAEHARYQYLKLLEKCKKIDCLSVHKRYPLYAGFQSKQIGSYELDFVYLDVEKGRWMYEDVKGVMTPLSKWKIRHFELQEGLKVTIVNRNSEASR